MASIYRKLIVWQKAMSLVTEIYRVSRTFPSDEKFGLTSQIRRAAVSIPSNIAEGQGRRTIGERDQFMAHAMGSAYEVATQLLIAGRLCYIEESVLNDLEARVEEVCRMLNAMFERPRR